MDPAKDLVCSYVLIIMEYDDMKLDYCNSSLFGLPKFLIGPDRLQNMHIVLLVW